MLVLGFLAAQQRSALVELLKVLLAAALQIGRAIAYLQGTLALLLSTHGYETDLWK